MLRSANVGERTRSVIPNPFANPFTNCVFPAPRSPTNPITHPGLNVLLSRLANASVSDELCEMNVATLRQRADSFRVFEADSRIAYDLANARERNIRKLFFPCIEQRYRIAA